MMKGSVAVLMALLVSVAAHAADKDVPAKQGFGFTSVSDTLAFLKTKPSVSFTTTKPDNWLIANDSEPFTIWSFTPEGHYAYLSCVRMRRLRFGGEYLQRREFSNNCTAVQRAGYPATLLSLEQYAGA